jgi:hypothetical protein
MKSMEDISNARKPARAIVMYMFFLFIELPSILLIKDNIRPAGRKHV